jgi:Fe-S-cluster containining protein
MKQYLTERSNAFNAWSGFSCPDGCERHGCKEPDLHISISLVDLVAISLVSEQKVLDLFRKDCKMGFDPIREGEPWVGRISIELRKPCLFLDGAECSVYSGRPTGCALFPEYNFMVGDQESLLKKDLFRNFPCIQNPCSIPARRKEILQSLMEMSIKEVFLSDFYLFGISPFVLDLKNVAGEGLEGIRTSEEGKAKIAHHRIEGLVLQRLKEGGYLDRWEVKIEQLDRADGLNRLAETKKWTDGMVDVPDQISLGIAYQFDGEKLLPIRLSK